MGLPEEICSAIPTTDTYTLEQGQDEFYFALPYQKMDVAVLFYNQGRSASELAGEIGIDEGIAHNVYKDIENKRKTTKYLHENPVLIEPVLP
jgi:NAD+ synthase